jgi:transcriptional regulator of acetoin/glycerol metabolism
METKKPSSLQDPVISSSWDRSASYGLTEDQSPPLDLAAFQQLRHQVEANARLVTFAQPIIEHLYQQLSHSSCMVMLADSEGLILRAVGDNGFVERASRVILMPGARWSEESMGTNAIGTAIHEARIVSVCRDQHFLERNRFLTCIATPILAPSGGILGILDLSSDARVTLPHAQALLSTTAEIIEHRILAALDIGHVALHFSDHAELLGSPLEAVALFDEAGIMVACNRRARHLLNLSEQAALPTFEEAFVEEWRHLGRLLATSRADTACLHRRNSRGSLSARLVLRDNAGNAKAAAGNGRIATGSAFACQDQGDPRLHEAIQRARRISGRDIPLLIQGETGTGKELFANAFHCDGPRGNGPFVAVNCAAIPANLIEAELFGYAPGAFTGARAKGARGKLQEADGGTLFLDEIGDMPLNLQSVLLRVLETRRVTPLSSAEEIPIDIALVCASHHPLNRLAAEGRFRVDLLFRLNGLMVTLPPLRDRRDFDQLVDSMLDAETGGRPLRIAQSVRAILRRHPWPGNIRQLKNVLRVAVALLGDDEELTEQHLPEDILEESAETPKTPPGSSDLRATELRLVRACLARHEGNVSAAARELGITRTTLYRKLRLHLPEDIQ